MKKIRVAVIGVGSLGQHHARNYASMPGAVLVAVADPDQPGVLETCDSIPAYQSA